MDAEPLHQAVGQGETAHLDEDSFSIAHGTARKVKRPFLLHNACILNQVKLLLEHADKGLMLLTSTPRNGEDAAVDEALQAEDEAMLQIKSIQIRDEGGTEYEEKPEEGHDGEAEQTETEATGEGIPSADSLE